MTPPPGASRLGTRFGPYELRSLIGVGGMGEVYRAYDTAKDRMVALKLLRTEVAADPTYQARFRRESRVAARLQEPHVIPVHDFGDIDGVLYIDMRLVEGGSVKDLLRSHGPLSPQRAAGIVTQIASALDAAHADGLVHRDIKPENVLLTGDDFAYLVDFGIAHGPGEASVTMAGMVIGSSAYMAPERFSGGPAGPAADIYALTCLLYESLTGRPPFDVGDLRQLMSAHMFTVPPRPSIMRRGIPKALDAVIARGMAKEPAQRYASARELARAATAAAASAPVEESPVTAPIPAPASATQQYSALYLNPTQPGYVPAPRGSGSRRARWVLPIATVLLFGVATVLAVILVRSGDGESTRATPLAAPPQRSVQTTTVTTSTTTPSALPELDGADAQGFVGHTARCDEGSSLTMLIRTESSLAVICREGTDEGQNFYYRGERLSDGAHLEITAAQRSGNGFVAVNPADGARYEVGPDGLTISSYGHIDSSEPPLEFGER